VADWIIVGVAIVGFWATVHTLIQARNRQRAEIEGYIRVDVGPPAGASGFDPPEQIAFIQSSYLEVLDEAETSDPMICVWYRNLQTHPLGVALGIVGKMVVELQSEGLSSSRLMR
jgi:hypothetical protein